jgi:hypothetical protein
MAGCGVEPESPAMLETVMPDRAYSDATIPITLLGGLFRPPLQVDTLTGAAKVGANPFSVFLDPAVTVALAGPQPKAQRPGGAQSVDALDAQWLDNRDISARLPAGIPPGDYVVGMIDPRGQVVSSSAVFTSLGPDLDPPLVTFSRPDPESAVGDGEKVSVKAHISDGPGHVGAARWWVTPAELGITGEDCAIPKDMPGEVDCNFSFIAPTAPMQMDLEPIEIHVQAADWVQNSTSSTLTLLVAQRPDAIVPSPDAGPTTGGTALVVTGAGFIVGLSQIIIDGTPIASVVQGDAIYGTTAPHVQGAFKLTVANGSSISGNELTFTFVAPPKVREVSPTSGPAGAWTQVIVAGNHFRPETQFYWLQNDVLHPVALDPAPDSAPAGALVQFVNSNRVTILLPPGSGVISIVAVDPVAGSFPLMDAFTYDDPAP